MKEEQKHIYYACGKARRDRAPAATRTRPGKGYDVCLTEDVDEFVIKIIAEWDGKEFKSVSSDDFDLGGKKN